MVSVKKEANLKKRATIRQELENLIGIFQQAGSNAAFLEIQERQKELQKLENQPMYQSTMPDITNYDVYIKSQSNPIPVRGRPPKAKVEQVEIIKPLSKPRGRPPNPKIEGEVKPPPKPRGRPKKINNVSTPQEIPMPQPKSIQPKPQESDIKEKAAKKRKDVFDEIDRRIKIYGETSELLNMRKIFKIMCDNEVIHTNPNFITETNYIPTSTDAKTQKKLKIGVKKIKQKEEEIRNAEDLIKQKEEEIKQISNDLNILEIQTKKPKKVMKQLDMELIFKPKGSSKKVTSQSEMDENMETIFKSVNPKTKQTIKNLQRKQMMKDLDLKIESQKEKIKMKKELIDIAQEEIKNMMKKLKPPKQTTNPKETKETKETKTKKPRAETYESYYRKLQRLFNADRYADEDKDLIMENLEKKKLSVDEIKSVFLGAVAHYENFMEKLETMRDDYEYDVEAYKEQGEPYETEEEFDDRMENFIADQPTIKWNYLINFLKKNPNFKMKGRTGKGIFTFDGLNKAFEGVDWTANRIQSSIKGYVMGRGDAYPPYVRDLIKKYGDQEIVGITISRNPVQNAIVGLLNVLSLGKFSKRMERAEYDKLFHLRLILKLKNGKKLAIEKNESINMDDKPKKLPKAEFKEVYNIPQGITVFNLLEAAQNLMGNKFFSYSASSNNCQDFVMALLEGSDIGDDEDIIFVKQDTEQLFEKYGYLKNISDKVTDLGGRFNEILYGAGC